MPISISNWLTRGISKKKLAKEKKKALKEYNKYMRKLKKEYCKKHPYCMDCEYCTTALTVTDTTVTLGNACLLDKQTTQIDN